MGIFASFVLTPREENCTIESTVKYNKGKHHGAIWSGVLKLKPRILLINNVVMGVRVEKIAGWKRAGTEKAALFTPAGDWLAVTSLKSCGK